MEIFDKSNDPTCSKILSFTNESQYESESKMPFGGLIPFGGGMKRENLAVSALLYVFIPGSLFLPQSYCNIFHTAVTWNKHQLQNSICRTSKID